jgi:hypothetical protein
MVVTKKKVGKYIPPKRDSKEIEIHNTITQSESGRIKAPVALPKLKWMEKNEKPT